MASERFQINSVSEDRPSSCGQLRRISAQSHKKRAQSDSRWLSQSGLHFIIQGRVNHVVLSKLADLSNLPSPQTMQVNQVDQKEKPWYQNIKNFIETGEFPPEMPKREQRAIQRMSTRYFILANILYRCGFSSEYARCLDKEEAMEIIQEAYEEICGGHARLSNSRQTNRSSRVLLKYHAAGLPSIREEVRQVSDARAFHSRPSHISAIGCFSLAIFYVGIRRRGPYYSFCFQRPQILSGYDRVLHEMG